MAKKARAPITSTARLGIPMPVRVKEDDDQRPLAVTLEGNTLEVVSIDERWEDESEWWEPEPVFKMHYQVTLEERRQVAIIRNMKTGGWYQMAVRG